MSQLTREFDWSKTSVGHPVNWPQSLRTTVSNLLRSKFPMFLWWGDDMIQFYNDAYRPSMGNEGKHPMALGQKGPECWPEIWDIIYPLMRQVETSGEAIWMENQLVPIFRNGKIEDVYWTYSYSSVLDDNGNHGGILVTCMETTESVVSKKLLEDSQRRLQESEDRFRNVIEQAPVAIGLTRGEDFVFESINPPMLQLINKKDKQEVLGKPLAEVLPELETQPVFDILKKVVQTGEMFSGTEIPAELAKEGVLQHRYFNITYSRVVDKDGIAFVLHMATDVTEQVMSRHQIEKVVAQRTKELAAANETLQEINKELQRSNAHLEEFAHAASHDLKEPVRKIQVFTSHLKSHLAERLNDIEVRVLSRIENSTQRMGTLIDDLLVYSHVSHRPHEKQTVDLNEKLQRVLEDLELDIEEKKAIVHVAKLPVIKGYERQLQQLFQNLVSNSLKYSKEDVPPEINISAETDIADDKLYHVIKVADNGIGFEMEYDEKIFQMFSRLHGKHEYSGTGVGLAIVKKVIENHAGLIHVESVPGEGSVFSIYLPAQ